MTSTAPAAGGVVNAIQGRLTVHGGTQASAGGDQLIVDDSGDGIASDANNLISFNAVTGLGIVRGFGMPQGIDFRAVEGSNCPTRRRSSRWAGSTAAASSWYWRRRA